jgi:pilus assembly protein Flp/PilA
MLVGSLLVGIFMLTSKRACNRQAGASLVEYALLVALIAIIAIVAVRSLGTTISQQFSRTASQITG